MDIASLEFKSTENIILFEDCIWGNLGSVLPYARFLLHHQLYFSILQILGNYSFFFSAHFKILWLVCLGLCCCCSGRFRLGGLIPKNESKVLAGWSVLYFVRVLKVKEKAAVCEFMLLYPVTNFLEWLLASKCLTQLSRVVCLQKGRVTPAVVLVLAVQTAPVHPFYNEFISVDSNMQNMYRLWNLQLTVKICA